MIQKFTISILALIFAISATAQKNVYLTVKHVLGANLFAYNQSATNDLGNNLKVSRIDYYMSKFVIIHDGGQTLVVPDNVIILAKGTTNVIKNLGNYNVINVEGIKFSIGVPSTYNNTDPALYVSPDPLAPQSPSMHWGWASGFRFIAIEGMAGASLNTPYEMHGLWNANYFSQTKTVAGVSSGDDIFINLDADYTQALKGINVTQGPIDHGVNATDLTVLQNFRDFVFSPGSGISTNINTVSNEFGISIFPNPSNGEFYIRNSNLNNSFSNVDIIDLTGRIISTNALQNTVDNKINMPSSGVYFLLLKTVSGEVISKKIIVE